MKTVGFIHTTMILVEVIKKELKEQAVEVDAFHLVDEGLLINLLKEGRLSPGMIKRLCRHVLSTEEAGADLMVVTCSSIAPAVDAARPLVSHPVLKIDEPMAERATEIGKRVGVVATVATTLPPTSSLLLKKAEEQGKEIQVSTSLCEEAFKAILQGDMEKHDRMVIEEAIRLARKVDVIVLAQGSMARLRPSLSQQVHVPVLSSPPLLVERLKKMV